MLLFDGFNFPVLSYDHVIWAVGGLIVTLASREDVIAWGAMVFGGLQFLKGVYQFMTTTP